MAQSVLNGTASNALTGAKIQYQIDDNKCYFEANDMSCLEEAQTLTKKAYAKVLLQFLLFEVLIL